MICHDCICEAHEGSSSLSWLWEGDDSGNETHLPKVPLGSGDMLSENKFLNSFEGCSAETDLKVLLVPWGSHSGPSGGSHNIRCIVMAKQHTNQSTSPNNKYNILLKYD